MTSLDLTMATTMAVVIRAWHDDHLDNPVGGAIVCCHNIRKVVYPRNLPPVTIKLSIMFVLGGQTSRSHFYGFLNCSLGSLLVNLYHHN